MWHCFMTGSPKDRLGRRMLKVIHSIEYLWYNLSAKRIDVWGDFFVMNTSREPARLIGLHPGNIEFYLATENWLADKRWTTALMKIAGKYMGLKIDSEKISLSRVGAELLRVELARESGVARKWSPPPPSKDAYVSFSGWESPVIEPGKCSLFRIVGAITGETYNHLLDDNQGERIQIMGGKPLEDMILSDLQKDRNNNVLFEQKFLQFIDEYIDKPSFYHVFFEFADARAAKCIEISHDMKEAHFNIPIDDRYVTWCCSDMDFNIFAKANGPVLVVSAKEHACGLSH